MYAPYDRGGAQQGYGLRYPTGYGGAAMAGGRGGQGYGPSQGAAGGPYGYGAAAAMPQMGGYGYAAGATGYGGYG